MENWVARVVRTTPSHDRGDAACAVLLWQSVGCFAPMPFWQGMAVSVVAATACLAETRPRAVVDEEEVVAAATIGLA